jgi:NADH-quinone oxidoreductase subunit L
VIGAGVTAFYMTRLMLMTWLGTKRWEKKVHPHESPKTMTIPLVVLAALSVLGGVLTLGHWIVTWLEPVVGPEVEHEPPLPALVISAIVVAVVAVGVLTAVVLVGRREVPRTAPAKVSLATRAAREDLYGDKINDTLVVGPGKRLVSGLLVLDRTVVDGTLMGGVVAVGGLGQLLRRAQNGYVRSYALSIMGGVLLVVLALLAVNLA